MKEKKIFDAEFLNTVFNQIYTNLYITDTQTDEIVYMNDTMKKTFHLDNLEGKVCWEVLQEGMSKRCHFCKINKLLKDRGKGVCVWLEENPVSGRTYRNIDSLLDWGGKIYHMQNSIDITRQQKMTEIANMDELTGMYNRRAGKDKLRKFMELARLEQTIFSVVMYDINNLKMVNDQHGHEEGDFLIKCIAAEVLEKTTEDDFSFRLSGDEFIISFCNANSEEAEQKMQTILLSLKQLQESLKLPYEISFSYGVAQVYPQDNYDVMDIISRADERMYRQKRAYHIKRAKNELTKIDYKNEENWFEYDKEHLYDALCTSTEDYIFVGNMKSGIFRYPPAMVKEFGLPGQVLENAAAFWSELIHPEDEMHFLESNQEIADGRIDYHDIEYRAKNVNKEWVRLRCKGKMIRDNKGIPDLFAGMISNLGRQNKKDQMTGLYDKYEFEGIIKKHLVDGERTENIYVMILNMDGFKNINDLYNRSFGDEVLRITAKKIVSLIPENAHLFRLDGDEFGIVILNSGEYNCGKLFRKIQQEFSKQQEYEGRKFYCTLSGGVSCFPENADNYLDLLKYANYSLESSKLKGKNRLTIFSAEILSEKSRKLKLTELLRESIERGFIGFYVCYQPKMDAKTKSLYGAEALARWNHKQLGEVSPGEFIPILEESGMIVELGRWVFKEAVRQCKEWLEMKTDFKMSINLSYQQIMKDDVITFVKEELKYIGVQPSAIMMELTETYLVTADRVAYTVMEQFRDIGMQTAMDDFGVGYSSLFSLKKIPVDEVKIDREFAKGISKDIFNEIFVKSITELCHYAGKRVCLEGVESEEEYETARKTGLELIQGYYFGRPVKPDVFEEMFLSDSN